MSFAEHVWHASTTTHSFGVAITLVCYQFGCCLQRRCNGNPIFNPVLIAIAAIVALLALSGTTYQTYFKSAAWIHFLLGPATVALAIPLYKNLGEIRRSATAIGVAVSAGALTASASAMGAAWALGASHEVIRSIAPKSVTTPIAIGVSAQIGGIPELTAVLVVLTGVFGALCAPELPRSLACAARARAVLPPEWPVTALRRLECCRWMKPLVRLPVFRWACADCLQPSCCRYWRHFFPDLPLAYSNARRGRPLSAPFGQNGLEICQRRQTNLESMRTAAFSNEPLRTHQNNQVPSRDSGLRTSRDTVCKQA